MKHYSILHLTLQILIFTNPRFGDWLAARGLQGTQILEFLRLRGLWRFVLDGLLAYWYWRGIAAAIGSRRGFRQWMVELPVMGMQSEARLDLRQGVVAAAAQLDAERPHSAQIWYGAQYVGQIPAQPGAERLNGVHLRPWLMEHSAKSLFAAFVAEESPAESLPFQAQILMKV